MGKQEAPKKASGFKSTFVDAKLAFEMVIYKLHLLQSSGPTVTYNAVKTSEAGVNSHHDEPLPVLMLVRGL